MGKLERPTRDFDRFFENVKKNGFNAKTVIDVGAARGTPPLHKAFPDAYFVLFEPVQEFIPELKQLMKKYQGEVQDCGLVSEEPGLQAKILRKLKQFVKKFKGEGPEQYTKIFRTRNNLYGSSLMHRVTDIDDDRLEDVKIKTLDRALAHFDELPKPFLLKTDCQGGDFDVVKGGVKVLSACEIIIMEVSFFKFWGNHHPDALEIFNFMNEQGFVIYDFLDGLFRPLDGALGQIDVVFVRKDSLLKKDYKWGL
jgi:FkbM family methyltransferase